MITYLAVCDPFVDLIKYFGELIQQQTITFLTDLDQVIHKLLNHITRISRRNKTLGLIISWNIRSYGHAQRNVFGFPCQLCGISGMIGFAFKVTFEIICRTIGKIL